jgi:hypothetical protein
MWCDAERQERLQLKARIEGWIEQQTEPVLYFQGRRVDRLNQVRFKLDCVVKSLVLNCRNRGMNLRARVLQASQDDFGTVALRTELWGRIEIFEIRPALETLVRRPLLETRNDFQRTVENLIRRNFAAAQILKSTVASDLEHSLSGKYVRLQFRSGGSGWVAIAAGPQENQATVDGLLSSGLLWRGFLRERGLAGQDKLLLLGPSNKLLVLKSRLAWISGAGCGIQLMAMDSETETLTSVDLGDCGNLDTALTQVQTLSDGKSVDDDERVRRVLVRDPSPAQGHASLWLAEPTRELGAEPAALPPDLVATTAENDAAAPWLDRLPKGFLAVHPGSGSPAKNWPPSRFLAIVERLSADQPWLLVEGPADEGAAESLRSHPLAVRAPGLPSRVLGTVMARAALYLGNDSGVSHLAAALGAPSVVLYTRGLLAWRPWAPHARVLVVSTEDVLAPEVEAIIDSARAAMA